MSRNPSFNILTADPSRNTLKSFSISRPQSGIDLQKHNGNEYSRPQSGLSGKCGFGGRLDTNNNKKNINSCKNSNENIRIKNF